MDRFVDGTARSGCKESPDQDTEFGSITVDGAVYEHDIVIRRSGTIAKRKKRLSKQYYGTSHTISLDEEEHIFDESAERLIIGSGQYGNVELSQEAKGYFKKKGCSVDLYPTPNAIQVWNEADGKVIAMFHLTC